MPSAGFCPEPDWSQVHQELRHKGMTLALLWEEYKAVHALGYQYSWFCERYREWSDTLGLVMRQEHRTGEKMFIDYTGQPVDVVVPLAGEVRVTQIFVAALGVSRLRLCRSHVDPGSARLDRLPLAGLPVFWRNDRVDSDRQPQVRGKQGLSLRARHQPDLPRRWPPTTARRFCPPGY
ncbi:hypothetical protein DFAR_2630002 [Desulfarculales bacterium]